MALKKKHAKKKPAKKKHAKKKHAKKKPAKKKHAKKKPAKNKHAPAHRVSLADLEDKIIRERLLGH
jgi:hypothetical protein